MEENAKCYTYEEIHFDDEVLPSVDVTYIIYLEGNGRYESIKKQLEEYHPTKLVYILHNKGFKKCEKKIVDMPPKDLVDAYLQIFKDAEKKNFDNILILEDDFIFSEKMKEEFHQDNINRFIQNKTGSDFIYYLGCAPVLLIPYDFYNYYGITFVTHSVIYSKKTIEKMNKLNQVDISDWDLQCCKFSNRYVYYLPLCYQLFPETENSKHWGYFSLLSLIIFSIVKQIIKILSLDVRVEPGYSILYFQAKMIFFILFAFLVFVIYVLYKYLPNRINKVLKKSNIK
jgi:hypothetical protein